MEFPALDVLMTRFGAALAIGVLIGMERESARIQRSADAPTGGEAEDGADPERALRARLAEGEASQIALADASEEERSGRLPAPRATPPEVESLDDPPSPAGVRTFTLVSLCGATAAVLSMPTGPWIFAVVLLAISGLAITSYRATSLQGDLGLTSEVGIIVTFLLGGLAAYGQVSLAGAVAVVVTLLLSLKRPLHALARRVDEADIHAVVKFAVLTLVVLPILPSDPIAFGARFGGPEGAWWRALEIDLQKVWVMVILISGISFCGYVLGQVVGESRGQLLTAFVGGLVSSTAVTLSFAERSKVYPERSQAFATGIVLANAIMPMRLLLVVSLVAPALFTTLAIPLVPLIMTGCLAVAVLQLRHRARESSVEVTLENPFEIGTALKFGLLFGVVLLLAQVGQGLFADRGLYLVAILTGLTDVDAIGLAVANLVRDEKQALSPAGVTVTLAVLSNTAVKAYFAATLGSAELRKTTLGVFALMFLTAGGGIAVLLLLP